MTIASTSVPGTEPGVIDPIPPVPPLNEPTPPIGEPEPDRLPDEDPQPNPDENDDPPKILTIH